MHQPSPGPDPRATRAIQDWVDTNPDREPDRVIDQIGLLLLEGAGKKRAASRLQRLRGGSKAACRQAVEAIHRRLATAYGPDYASRPEDEREAMAEDWHVQHGDPDEDWDHQITRIDASDVEGYIAKLEAELGVPFTRVASVGDHRRGLDT